MPRLLLLLSLALSLVACPDPDDDDDITDDDDDVDPGDDDDVIADDDDAADDDDDTPCFVSISGAVIALDRESGAVLSDAEYEARAGGLLLYLLPDPGDLSVIFDKVTMTGPGAYTLPLAGCVGTASVVAVVDQDRDFIIGSNDVAREHAFNPLLLPANGLVEDVNVYVDLPRIEDPNGGGDDDDDDSWGPGGPGDDDDDKGGPGGPGDDDDLSGPGDDDDLSGPDDDDDLSGPDDDDDASIPDDDDDDDLLQCPSAFSGDVIVTDLPSAPVVATANEQNMLEGPWAVAYLGAPGEFSMDVPCLDGWTSFMGILDADENLFFEPSDPVGTSDNNPWTLGLPPTTGVHIEIPSVDGVLPPAPPPYDGISGVVIFDDFLTGDILVHATAVHPSGQLYSVATLAAPGPFALIAPPGSTDVLVWAVLDEDGDGLFDVYADPYDSHGPFDLADGASGIELNLAYDPPEPGTISGQILWPADDATGADCLRVALFDEEPIASNSNPTILAPLINGPSFPSSFLFVDVPAGQWWVSGFLDLLCDNDQGGPGPEDPEGRTDWPVQLPSAGVVDDVEVILAL